MAAELDPLSLGPQLNQVEDLLEERKYPEARNKVEQVLRTAPSNGVALTLENAIAFWQKDCAAAKASSGKLIEMYPQAPGARLAGFAAESVCGNPDRARAQAARMFQQASGNLSPYSIAGAIALSGNADHVMPYLEKSAELREPRLLMLKYDRVFDTVRQDPRFLALERRLGLLE